MQTVCNIRRTDMCIVYHIEYSAQKYNIIKNQRDKAMRKYFISVFYLEKYTCVKNL